MANTRPVDWSITDVKVSQVCDSNLSCHHFHQPCYCVRQKAKQAQHSFCLMRQNRPYNSKDEQTCVAYKWTYSLHTHMCLRSGVISRKHCATH